MKTPITCILLCLLATKLAFAHQSHPAGDSQYQLTNITPSLSMLSKKGGNIIVSQGDDGLLIIDNGYADLASDLQTALQHIEQPTALKYIINTHWHFDHTGANELLGQSATIVAHDNVRKRLSTASEIPLFNYKGKAHPKHALPSLTYPQAMRIHFNNDELQLQHYANSHTDGDTVVFFKHANLIHMGDLMFYPNFPFVDIHNGGNAINYANNIKQINNSIDDQTVVIPGHGPITDKKGLSKFQHMLETTVEEVKAMKDKGLDLNAAQKQGLSKQWESWGKGFIDENNWISFIYQSL